MLDNVLIIIILFSIALSVFVVKNWKKNHFVKELYISKGASIVLLVIIIVNTIVLLTVYFVFNKGLYSWLYLLMVLLSDLLLLFIYCIIDTVCIYLKDNMLISKNIFITKKILINRETKIIEKIDIYIVKSKKKSIFISSRYLTGSINNLMNNVKIIINK